MWMQYLLQWIEASHKTKIRFSSFELTSLLHLTTVELRRKKDGGTDNIWRKSQNEVEFHVYFGLRRMWRKRDLI